MSVGLSKSDSLSLRKQVLLACDYCSTLSAERAQHCGKSIEMLGILGRPPQHVLFVDFMEVFTWSFAAARQRNTVMPSASVKASLLAASLSSLARGVTMLSMPRVSCVSDFPCRQNEQILDKGHKSRIWRRWRCQVLVSFVTVWD